MNQKLEKLAEWGCDIKGALDRTLNDEDFYLECLNDVISDEPFSALNEALKGNDEKEAFQAAHALKGVLSNVGLTPMYNIAVKMVEYLRNNNFDSTRQLYEELLVMKEYLKKIMKT